MPPSKDPNPTNDELHRRRLQNRMAQRRFRGRKRQEKASQHQNLGLNQSQPCEFPVIDICLPPPDLPLSPGFTAKSAELRHQDTENIEFGSLAASIGVDIDCLGEIQLNSSPAAATLQAPLASTNLDFDGDAGTKSDLAAVESGEVSFECEYNVKGWCGPLHLAAQKGHDNIARILLESNIDSNEKDSDGLTPLMHATIHGHQTVVTVLLSHGAYLSEVDNQCRSVLHWAVLHRQEALLQLSPGTMYERGLLDIR